MHCHICNYYTPETGCNHYLPEPKIRMDHLDAEITRLAKEFLKEPICPANMQYHNDILDKQCEAIRELKELKKSKQHA